MMGCWSPVERNFDLLAYKVFPPADTVRVDMLQHAHAVARASSDLAGCSSGVQHNDKAACRRS
jgi:hypothetical protein